MVWLTECVSKVRVGEFLMVMEEIVRKVVVVVVIVMAVMCIPASLLFLIFLIFFAMERKKLLASNSWPHLGLTSWWYRLLCSVCRCRLLW